MVLGSGFDFSSGRGSLSTALLNIIIDRKGSFDDAGNYWTAEYGDTDPRESTTIVKQYSPNGTLISENTYTEPNYSTSSSSVASFRGWSPPYNRFVKDEYYFRASASDNGVVRNMYTKQLLTNGVVLETNFINITLLSSCADLSLSSGDFIQLSLNAVRIYSKTGTLLLERTSSQDGWGGNAQIENMFGAFIDGNNAFVTIRTMNYRLSKSGSTWSANSVRKDESYNAIYDFVHYVRTYAWRD